MLLLGPLRKRKATQDDPAKSPTAAAGAPDPDGVSADDSSRAGRPRRVRAVDALLGAVVPTVAETEARKEEAPVAAVVGTAGAAPPAPEGGPVMAAALGRPKRGRGGTAASKEPARATTAAVAPVAAPAAEEEAAEDSDEVFDPEYLQRPKICGGVGVSSTKPSEPKKARGPSKKAAKGINMPDMSAPTVKSSLPGSAAPAAATVTASPVPCLIPPTGAATSLPGAISPVSSSPITGQEPVDGAPEPIVAPVPVVPFGSRAPVPSPVLSTRTYAPLDVPERAPVLEDVVDEPPDAEGTEAASDSGLSDEDPEAAAAAERQRASEMAGEDPASIAQILSELRGQTPKDRSQVIEEELSSEQLRLLIAECSGVEHSSLKNFKHKSLSKKLVKALKVQQASSPLSALY